MDFKEIMEERYSLREFSSKAVETKIVQQILELVRLSPTALNHEPYRIIVINSSISLSKIYQAKAPDYGASTVLLLCEETSNRWQNRYSNEDNTLMDIGIVLGTILYAAKEYDVGSCPVCNFDPKAIKEEFKLGDDLYPCALVYLGYPSSSAKASPRHFLRRKVDEFTSWE